MPIIANLEAESAKAVLIYGPITPGLELRRSYTNNVDKSDVLFTFDGPAGEYVDQTLLLDWTYYYWIVSHNYSTGAKTIVWGPESIQLKTVRLEGSRHRRRFFDRDVECPLCGTTVKKSRLRRGYVAPHAVGENYLPYAAAPESWAAEPYSTLPNFNCFQYDYTFFPQIEKPYQFKYPGVPLMGSGFYTHPVHGAQTWSTRILFPTTPTTSSPGKLYLWYKSTDDTVEGSIIRITGSISGTLQEIPLWTRGKAWNRATIPVFSWAATETFRVTHIASTADLSTVAFGGMQIVKTHELSALPDRATALGEYTVGGMMLLCPECYSGLRRRVPWES